jgi:hypothetical protein
MIRATKRLLAALTFIGVIGFIGCDAGSFAGPQLGADAPPFSLSPSEMTLGVGESATITPSLVRSNGAPVNPKSLSWSSTDAGSATVNGDGVVTGVAPGHPMIIARSGNLADTTRLRIVARGETKVGVKTSPDTVVLNWINATATVSATVTNSDGTQVAEPGLTWTSLNPSIAQMDSRGVITAKGVGVALIVATAACCDQADTAYARVEQVVDSVDVDPDAVSLSSGSSVQLRPTAFDRGGTRIDNATFTFRSANESVAKVSNDGVVTSQSDGTTAVTATSEGRSDHVAVTVASGTTSSGSSNEPAGFVKISEHRGSPWPKDWWLHDPDNNISVVQDNNAPVPSWGTIRYRFPEGHLGGRGPGMMGHGSGNAGGAKNMKVNGQPVREVYLRVWVRYSTGWQNPDAVSKMYYTYQMNADGTHRNFLHMDLTGARVQPSYGTKIESEVSGSVVNLNPNMQAVDIIPGVWFLHELYSRAASAEGVNDGIVRWWINGTLVGQHTNLRRSHHPFTELHWNPVWGGGSSIPVQNTQYIDFNGLYVSGR